MSHQVVFRAAAQAELDDAAAWYEEQKLGLGADFVNEVERQLNVIASQPDRYPIVTDDVHEALVNRFPYCVYYRVKSRRIVILAVFHTARDPAIWRNRR